MKIFVAQWAAFLIAMWLGWRDFIPEGGARLGAAAVFGLVSLAISYVLDLWLES